METADMSWTRHFDESLFAEQWIDRSRSSNEDWTVFDCGTGCWTMRRSEDHMRWAIGFKWRPSLGVKKENLLSIEWKLETGLVSSEIFDQEAKLIKVDRIEFPDLEPQISKLDLVVLENILHEVSNGAWMRSQ